MEIKEDDLRINEDFLLLLISNGDKVDIINLKIDKLYFDELTEIENLCSIYGDNTKNIIEFLNQNLRPRLINKTLKYCQDLDKAYQSVIVNIDDKISNILLSKNIIYFNKELFEKREIEQKNKDEHYTKKEFDLGEEFSIMQNNILNSIKIWFKAIEIENSYRIAELNPNMLTYSHRLCGWSNPEYKITQDLSQEIKTNFGYGSVSYFFILLKFKKIQIIPFSDWTDYRYANFSEVIRYTKDLKWSITPIDIPKSIPQSSLMNEHWYSAMEFTKKAANTLLYSESEFVNVYIVQECEKMVNRLQNFLDFDEIITYNNGTNSSSIKPKEKTRIDINGFELVSFKSEKIIGALDFIEKINEYNKITPTTNFIDRIKQINISFIPNVHIVIKSEKIELDNSKKEFLLFKPTHDALLVLNKILYQKRKELSEEDYLKFFNTEFKDYENIENFKQIFHNSCIRFNYLNAKVILHKNNVDKMVNYVNIYDNFFAGEPLV